MNWENPWLATAALAYAAGFAVFVTWRITRKARRWSR
jgi:hypothetical protein